MSDALYTDGNDAAGLLAQVLAVDPTSVRRRCRSCGEEHAVGEHRAYRGAGIVLRCPACGDAGVRIGLREDCVTIEWRGAFTIELTAA